MNDLYIGLIIGIVVTFIGQMSHLVYEYHKGERKRHEEGLKNHFKDLEIAAIKPLKESIEKLSNSHGEFAELKLGYAYRPTWLTRDFQYGKFNIFKLHFPSQAEAIKAFINSIDKHNEKLDSFTESIERVIKQKTNLPIKHGGLLPFISDEVPEHLRVTLYQLAEKKSLKIEKMPLTHDFRKAEVQPGYQDWRLATGSSSYAATRTEDEAKLCKQCLIELMESAPLLEEMSELYEEAKRLESEATRLAEVLDFTCQQYNKYGKLLKRKRDCPICQVIFK